MVGWDSTDDDAFRRGRAAWAEEWRAVAADTRPADRVRAEAAVRAEYEAYLRAESADPLSDGETDRDLERLYTYLLRALAR